MARPSFTIPDELLDEFDQAIFEKKIDGELHRDTSRSEVVRELIEEYIEDHKNEGNRERAAAMTAD